MPKSHIRLVCTGVWLGLLLFATGAESAPLTKDRVDVLQLKSITKKRRHELTPMFSVGLNDNFVQLLNVGGVYTFHITEGFAFDLRFSYAFPLLTSLVNDMRESGPNALLQPNVGSSATDKFNPTLSRPQIFASAHFLWSPLIGKFMLGKAVVDFDMYIFAGGGYIYSVQPGGKVSHSGGVSFGGGWRLLLTRWLTMRLEIQDMIYTQRLSGDGGEVSLLTHRVFLSIGFGFLFPISPVYTFEREP